MVLKYKQYSRRKMAYYRKVIKTGQTKWDKTVRLMKRVMINRKYHQVSV